MVQQLIRYIEDARKQGFAVEDIKSHLLRHGWNDYLIEYAASQVERRNDRKWLQGSLMAVFAIVILTSGTVWWVEHKNTVGPMGIPCLFEANDGSVETFANPSECCQRVGRVFCEPVRDGAQIRDTKGNVLFTAQVSCRDSDGRLLAQERVMQSCSTKSPKKS